MKRFIIPALIAIAFAFAWSAAPVNAASITLVKSSFKNTGAGDNTDSEQIDPHQFVVSHSFGSHNTTFVDTFKFTISGLKTSLNFLVTTVNAVNNMNFNLYDKNGNVLFSTSGFQTAYGQTKTQLLTFTGALLQQMLTSGTLTMKITGDFCHCSSYSIAVFPIPPALLMFLTALGSIGLFAWRRNGWSFRSQAAQA